MRWDVTTSCGATRHEDPGNYDVTPRINSLFASHILDIKPTGTVLFPSKLHYRYDTGHETLRFLQLMTSGSRTN